MLIDLNCFLRQVSDVAHGPLVPEVLSRDIFKGIVPVLQSRVHLFVRVSANVGSRISKSRRGVKLCPQELPLRLSAAGPKASPRRGLVRRSQEAKRFKQIGNQCSPSAYGPDYAQ